MVMTLTKGSSKLRCCEYVNIRHSLSRRIAGKQSFRLLYWIQITQRLKEDIYNCSPEGVKNFNGYFLKSLLAVKPIPAKEAATNPAPTATESPHPEESACALLQGRTCSEWREDSSADAARYAP